MTTETVIWLDGGEKKVIADNVTDLDVASRHLGYADYQDMLEELDFTDPEDSPINFKWREV